MGIRISVDFSGRSDPKSGSDKKTDPNSKPKGIPKKTRGDVWVKYNGNRDRGLCYTCGKTVYRDGWHCSHVIARSKGGGVNVENLRVCCQHCNLSMRNKCIYDFIREKGLKGPGSRTRV